MLTIKSFNAFKDFTPSPKTAQCWAHFKSCLLLACYSWEYTDSQNFSSHIIANSCVENSSTAITTFMLSNVRYVRCRRWVTIVNHHWTFWSALFLADVFDTVKADCIHTSAARIKLELFLSYTGLVARLLFLLVLLQNRASGISTSSVVLPYLPISSPASQATCGIYSSRRCLLKLVCENWIVYFPPWPGNTLLSAGNLGVYLKCHLSYLIGSLVK